MNVRAVTLTIVAFLLGALAAGSIGVRVIREVGTEEEATSLPPSATTTVPPTAPTTYQIDPNETVIASTSLVPATIEGGDERLAIGYDLITLAPHEGVPPIEFVGGFGVVTVVENEDLDHIYPRSWILTTTSGAEILGGPASSQTRVARFEVPVGFSISEIAEVRVVEALAAFPIEVAFTLSESEPETEVFPGVRVELLNVSPQGDTTIVQVAIDLDDPEEAGFFVLGDGPGWRSANFEAEGRRRVNLVWAGGDLPDAIPLRATGSVWSPIDGEFTVSLEGLL